MDDDIGKFVEERIFLSGTIEHVIAREHPTDLRLDVLCANRFCNFVEIGFHCWPLTDRNCDPLDKLAGSLMGLRNPFLVFSRQLFEWHLDRCAVFLYELDLSKRHSPILRLDLVCAGRISPRSNVGLGSCFGLWDRGNGLA